MINKNSKILMGCLALLLVMSVGYALFSDTITVDGSATAKGEFELTLSCDEDDSLSFGNRGSASDAKITCKDNIVSASATLDYPDSAKWFRVMVTNTGTIPAKLKKVVELNNPDEMICEQGNCSGTIWNIISNEDDTNIVIASIYPDLDWAADYAEGAFGYNPAFDEAQMDAVLDPGETAHFYVGLEWAGDSTQQGEPLVASLNAQIDWQQVTVE